MVIDLAIPFVSASSLCQLYFHGMHALLGKAIRFFYIFALEEFVSREAQNGKLAGKILAQNGSSPRQERGNSVDVVGPQVYAVSMARPLPFSGRRKAILPAHSPNIAGVRPVNGFWLCIPARGRGLDYLEALPGDLRDSSSCQKPGSTITQ